VPVFLVVCRANNSLELLALPSLARVASFQDLGEGHAALHAVDDGQVRSSRFVRPHGLPRESAFLE
jgi:hypothetical protein